MVKKKKNIVQYNRLLYSLLSLLILTWGVIFVYATIETNPGHSIQNIAPPAGCLDGQILQWDQSVLEWVCVDSSFAGGGVPSGAVGFFNLLSCPSGWSPLTDAEGRVIVGVSSSGTLAGTQGTVLTDLGTRTINQVVSHTHSATTSSAGSHSHSFNDNTHGEQWTNGDWNTPYEGGLYTVYKTTSSAGSHTHSVTVSSAGASSVDVSMPYIQFLVCVKD